jgi:hypothetical protein
VSVRVGTSPTRATGGTVCFPHLVAKLWRTSDVFFNLAGPAALDGATGRRPGDASGGEQSFPPSCQDGTPPRRGLTSWQARTRRPHRFLRSGRSAIWSCSVWGLPCPLHYCNGGALLPHLFTLTSLPRRYVLCGTSRQPGLNPASRTLSGTLLCGVRTFLPRRRSAESDRPVLLTFRYKPY